MCSTAAHLLALLGGQRAGLPLFIQQQAVQGQSGVQALYKRLQAVQRDA